MKPEGQIVIHITGKKGNDDLSPANYDISEMRVMMDCAEKMLYPGSRGKRPPITMSVEDGSITNVFGVTKQAERTFAAVLLLISSTQSIDSLEMPSAIAVEKMQKYAIQHNVSFGLKTASDADYTLEITPSTNYFRSENLCVDAEFYFYGQIQDAGGIGNSNIHLLTSEYGKLVISADKETLRDYDKNILYKEYGIRAICKQNMSTGEIDTSEIKLVEIIDYSPGYDEEYLQSCIKATGDRFKGITDVNAYIAELRGYGA